MRAFQVDGRTIIAYLAVPEHGSGPGVLVLHAWWGLTEPFRQVCDWLAEAGFVAGASAPTGRFHRVRRKAGELFRAPVVHHAPRAGTCGPVEPVSRTARNFWSL